MFNKRSGFFDDSIQIEIDEFGRGCPREIQQGVDDLARPERLLGNLLEQPRFLVVARDLLGQHLRIGRDDRERRIHLVRHARGQQAD